MRYILFYATQNDLRAIIDAVEQVETLKYVKMGLYITEAHETTKRGTEIPNLGIADADSAVRCASYLVAEIGCAVRMRAISRIDGTQRFCIDQLLNPESVVFTPAGVWGNDTIIHGRIATVSDSKVPQRLMKRFASAIKERFEKINAFYVGPDAAALFDSGHRLTMATQSSPTYDLKR